MRPSSLFLLPLALRALASEHRPSEKELEAAADGSTVFNDRIVPEFTHLTSENLKDKVKNGNHLVEFYSPYCGHCKYFAPFLQTVYEFYYTQDVPGDQEGQDFTSFYDFHFEKVDCVTNGDICSDLEIKSFPTMILYKDGKEVKQNAGTKDIKFMSNWIEETLESIKPGTRPKTLTLPKKGDHEVEKTLLPEQPPSGPVNKEGATTTAKASSTLTATKIATVATPNPEGKSKALTAETFQRLVTTTHDPWFIKFYAPWCHHCQAMAPNWQGMARQMKGQLNIGEVNCEAEKRLCKDVKVKGYPTLLFFRGGERIEYDGLRGLGDLLGFANKAIAVAEPVRSVNAAEFEELEKKEEVIFLYFYDHATTNEDFAALERLTMSLIGHAKLVKTNDYLLAERYKISTWPRLLVSRDGKATYYTALSPRDMRDFRRVLNWMQSVWLPIVPELTSQNAKEIMGGGKLVVLGILNRGDINALGKDGRQGNEDWLSAKREIKNAALEWIDKQTQAFQLERQELRDAKQLRIEEAEDRNDQRALRAAKSIRINMDDIERREVGFAWVDGVFWERWIRTTFGISVASDGERVVMYDYGSHRYWDVTSTGNPIVPSRTSILETLPRVVSRPPKLEGKRTMSVLGHAWWVCKEQVWEHPRVSGLVAIGILIGLIVVGRRNAHRVDVSSLQSLPGYFKVGEKGGPMDGLLGGSGVSQGKVD